MASRVHGQIVSMDNVGLGFIRVGLAYMLYGDCFVHIDTNKVNASWLCVGQDVVVNMDDKGHVLSITQQSV